MARKKPVRRRWGLYALAFLVLAATIGALAYWWDMRSWAPEPAIYPDQGVLVSDREGLVSFDTVRAIGGKFAYLEASRGAKGQDTRFGRNLAAARRAGLKVGAVHLFDLCSSADAQSANFVTKVPRDSDLLPPAIALIGTADHCPEKVSDAAVESELMTFINQVEIHAGKRAILKLSRDFQERYQVAGAIERDLWLERDRFAPTYAGRPWLLWSANAARVTEASDLPIEWVVVQR
ncbi:MAG: lysozyme [Alphaproteobacteria bacterium]|nr:MAG: lysozyme [Alphaproteobacteria bacterium]